MAGIRHFPPDLNYYLNDMDGKKIAGTRLLNWADEAGIGYILFHMDPTEDSGCDDVILCTAQWDVKATADLYVTGSNVVIDLLLHSWLLTARWVDAPPLESDNRWYMLHVADDVLTDMPDSLVEEMQIHRMYAREGWRHRRDLEPLTERESHDTDQDPQVQPAPTTGGG
jgi:hypothetical protein